MKRKPEEMSVAELRAEPRALGVTDRLTALVRREMAAAERRARTSGGERDGGPARYDPLRAQLHVLKAYGMTTPDLRLNRKGMLVVTLTTREEIEGSVA